MAVRLYSLTSSDHTSRPFGVARGCHYCLRGITITKKRRAKLIAEMEVWMASEPEEGELKAG